MMIRGSHSHSTFIIPLISANKKTQTSEHCRRAKKKNEKPSLKNVKRIGGLDEKGTSHVCSWLLNRNESDFRGVVQQPTK